MNGLRPALSFLSSQLPSHEIRDGVSARGSVWSPPACGQPGRRRTKPPAPYTPVKAPVRSSAASGGKRNWARCCCRSKSYAAGQPLLAGPVRIVAEPDVLAGAKGKSKVTERTADKATWEWSGESAAFRIAVRMTGECDGFCWYDLELSPKQPVKMSLLRLEIPRLARTARYLHAANFTWTHLPKDLPEYGGSGRTSSSPMSGWATKNAGWPGARNLTGAGRSRSRRARFRSKPKAMWWCSAPRCWIMRRRSPPPSRFALACRRAR